MFYCEKVRNGYKYCTCFRQWKSLKLVHIDYQSPLLEIFITPFCGGDEVIFLRLKHGDPIPHCFNFEMNFLEWQHFRIRVVGGDIVIVGDVVDAAATLKPHLLNHFPSVCPFSDEDDWNFVRVHKGVEKYLKDELQNKEQKRADYFASKQKDKQ